MRKTVEDLMTADVVVAHQTDSFKHLVELLRTHEVSAVPVVDADDRVIGIVSEADLLLKEEHPDEPPWLIGGRHKRIDWEKSEGLTAGQVMTKEAVTVRPTAPPAEAARLMHEHGIKRLPVIAGDGRLVGILSRSDLLKVFLRPDEDILHEVRTSVLKGMLWIGPDNVGVTVHDGVVTLEGRLEQLSTTQVLAGLVGGLEGVVGVVNRLEYDEDDVSPRYQFRPGAAAVPGAVG